MNKFDKNKPLGPYNFPIFSYAKYRFYGYKTDEAGIKHPINWTETLPMGKKITFRKKDYKGITITKVEKAVGGPKLI